jgi:DNA-binding MarR family transcriptional regulator
LNLSQFNSIIKLLDIQTIKMDIKQHVFTAARENGINSVLFRNATARKLGLSVTDSECLSLLSIKGVCTPKELAHYTGLTSGSTTAMLDRLEKRNFIKRTPNPNDRRGVLIEINKEYAQKAAPLVAGIQKAHQELINTYSEKELEIIADFLTRFTNNVIEHTQKIEKAR